MSQINISALVADFEAYYLDGGQNESRLYNLLYRASVTESMFTPIRTNSTKWRGSKTSISSLLQAFQKKFTPKGGLTFEPLEISVFRMKADDEIYPDEIVDSWAGFLDGLENEQDRKKWPLIRYIVEKHWIPKIREEYELEAIFGGKREEPADNVAGDAWQVMDGIRHLRNKGIQDGKVDPIIMGAIPADDVDFVDYIEEMSDSVKKNYWNKSMIWKMSETLERRYLRGKGKKYGLRNNFTGEDKTVDNTNMSVMGLPSFGDSEIIIATPKDNAVFLYKGQKDIGRPNIESEARLVKLWHDWYKGIGYILRELIFTNDLDLGAPTVDTVDPLAAAAAGGTEITLTGKDFTGATAVKLGTVSGSTFTPVGNGTNIDVLTDRKLTFDTPNIAADTYAVQVTTPYGVGHSEEVLVVS